jgi:hypothetical protein
MRVHRHVVAAARPGRWGRKETPSKNGQNHSHLEGGPFWPPWPHQYFPSIMKELTKYDNTSPEIEVNFFPTKKCWSGQDRYLLPFCLEHLSPNFLVHLFVLPKILLTCPTKSPQLLIPPGEEFSSESGWSSEGTRCARGILRDPRNANRKATDHRIGSLRMARAVVNRWARVLAALYL